MNPLRLSVPMLAGSILAACGSAGDPSASSTSEQTATTRSALTQLFCPPGTHAVCPTPSTCKCVTDTDAILQGTVTGLVGTGLTLADDGFGVAVSGNGPTSIPVKMNEVYSIDINTDPTGPLQACYVVNGTGVGRASGMTPFTVNCGTAYLVGGTVSGLAAGAGAPYLTLSLQSPSLGGAPLVVTQNGPFTFPMPIANAQKYQVVLQGTPSGENCSVANGSGQIAGSNVTNVAVTCSPCGGVGEPECVSGNACQSGYTPDAQGTCVPCGGAQQPVCAMGNACNAGYTPSGGICVPCGGNQEPACASGNACNPGFTPNSQGICVACNLATQGITTATYLTDLFKTLRTDAASIQVTNETESFIPPPSVLTGINFPTPPTKQVSVGSFSGTFPIGPTTAGYTVTVTNIPQLSVTWPAWTGGANGVTINATFQGTLDTSVEVSDVFDVTVTPTISLNGLPVTITFGTDGNGNATLPTSNVTLGSMSQYVSVSGCGAFDWCDGLASNMLNSSASQLQSFIASQFASSLNGNGPFWALLMTALADQGKLTNPAGLQLPAEGTSSAAGTLSSWTFDSMQGYTNSVVTANFTGVGICYLN